MFKIGEYIVYGTSGVCKVESVSTMDMEGVPKDRLYYTLKPVYINKSTIMTPVDNTKVVMRSVMTKEEVDSLIDDMEDIETVSVNDDKKRGEICKNTLASCESRELVRMIKSLYNRNQRRLAQGKKLTSGDERYFHMAEDSLYGEMAITLNIDKSEVPGYISERIGNKLQTV